jgi:hypothetical protein
MTVFLNVTARTAAPLSTDIACGRILSVAFSGARPEFQIYSDRRDTNFDGYQSRRTDPLIYQRFSSILLSAATRRVEFSPNVVETIAQNIA